MANGTDSPTADQSALTAAAEAKETSQIFDLLNAFSRKDFETYLNLGQKFPFTHEADGVRVDCPIDEAWFKKKHQEEIATNRRKAKAGEEQDHSFSTLSSNDTDRKHLVALAMIVSCALYERAVSFTVNPDSRVYHKKPIGKFSSSGSTSYYNKWGKEHGFMVQQFIKHLVRSEDLGTVIKKWTQFESADGTSLSKEQQEANIENKLGLASLATRHIEATALRNRKEKYRALSQWGTLGLSNINVTDVFDTKKRFLQPDIRKQFETNFLTDFHKPILSGLDPAFPMALHNASDIPESANIKSVRIHPRLLDGIKKSQSFNPDAALLHQASQFAQDVLDNPGIVDEFQETYTDKRQSITGPLARKYRDICIEVEDQGTTKYYQVPLSKLLKNKSTNVRPELQAAALHTTLTEAIVHCMNIDQGHSSFATPDIDPQEDLSDLRARREVVWRDVKARDEAIAVKQELITGLEEEIASLSKEGSQLADEFLNQGSQLGRELLNSKTERAVAIAQELRESNPRKETLWRDMWAIDEATAPKKEELAKVQKEIAVLSREREQLAGRLSEIENILPIRANAPEGWENRTNRLQGEIKSAIEVIENNDANVLSSNQGNKSLKTLSSDQEKKLTKLDEAKDELMKSDRAYTEASNEHAKLYGPTPKARDALRKASVDKKAFDKNCKDSQSKVSYLAVQRARCLREVKGLQNELKPKKFAKLK